MIDENPRSNSSSQIVGDAKYVAFFTALSFGGTILGLPGFAVSALTTLGGLSFIDRMTVHAKRYFGDRSFEEKAEALIAKIKKVSGYLEVYNEEEDPNYVEDLHHLIKVITGNIYSAYTRDEHLESAGHILDLVNDYLNEACDVLVVESQREGRQSVFCEIMKGGHFVFTPRGEKHMEAIKSKSIPRASSHYKDHKIGCIKNDLVDLEKLLHQDESIEQMKESRRVHLVETYLTPDEAEIISEYFSNTRELIANRFGMIQPILEKAQSRAQYAIEQLSKPDGLSGFDHIDTDASISAGPIFNECLLGHVYIDGKRVTWAQLEGHSHHRDVTTEGPLSKLVNGMLNIVSLNGWLFSYNTNKLGHHIDFVQYWWHNKKLNVGQYGMSYMTENHYLEQRAEIKRQTEQKKKAIRQSPSIGELLRRNPSFVVERDPRLTQSATAAIPVADNNIKSSKEFYKLK